MKKIDKFYYFKDDPIEKSFANSVGGKIIKKSDFYKNTNDFKDSCLIIRGLKHESIMVLAKEHNIKFAYIDTGYMGNFKDKRYHRIVINGVQNYDIVERDGKRLKDLFTYLKKTLNIKRESIIRDWNVKDGYILLCPPSRKSLDFYNIDHDLWINNITEEIRKYSNNKIKIR